MAQPNARAAACYGDSDFQKLVANEAVECTQIAQTLQDAADGAGVQITINPTPATNGLVRWPTKLGPASGNYHTVFTDNAFVFDPRYRDTPIPIAEWEAVVDKLNDGENVFGR